MKNRLVMSLSFLSIGIWIVVILLLMFPSEESAIGQHSERVSPTLQMKSSDKLPRLASDYEAFNMKEVNEKYERTWEEKGLTRSWANEWSEDGTFSIDDLLTKLEIQ
ncbi:hypothetical protein N780_06310 [Pontibacillus chungwhensis BH030062]|uniref:Uncharacterized protein n=1 Tax=Pontibacillus chungwhensis BH030062 TaxID=1385513 RepID=A0A0A2UTX3_9BACI|nr:hypothetical protein [Pontibacillus chungwhensis]KGP90218.1 hypothetical protein N780_06310 [Pontibacillus chungwhensis BH030062]